MKNKYPKLTMFFLCMALVAILPTAQATDIFLSFPDNDIVGESVQQDHVDEVRVLSFSWGLLTEAGKKSTTNVDISEFSIIKHGDLSSGSLLTKAVMGENLGRAVVKIHSQLAGTDSRAYDSLVLTLNDAVIASVSSDIDGGVDRVLEKIVFTFSTISGVYTKIDKVTGSRTTRSFNIVGNAP